MGSACWAAATSISGSWADVQPGNESIPAAPVVLVSRGTGAGTLAPDTVITTPDHQPNVIIKVVTPLWVIFIRSFRVFLQTLLGLLTAAMVAPKALPAEDFMHLLTLCASLSVASAGVCIIQNGIELLGQLDQKFPTLTS